MTHFNKIIGQPTKRAILTGTNVSLLDIGPGPVRLFSVTTFSVSGLRYYVYPTATIAGDDFFGFRNEAEGWSSTWPFNALWLPFCSLMIGDDSAGAGNRLVVTYLTDGN